VSSGESSSLPMLMGSLAACAGWPGFPIWIWYLSRPISRHALIFAGSARGIHAPLRFEGGLVSGSEVSTPKGNVASRPVLSATARRSRERARARRASFHVACIARLRSNQSLLILMYSSTFCASTSSGTLPPRTRMSSKALRSYRDPSAACARARCRFISLCPTL
jgi:hypothetical protein